MTWELDGVENLFRAPLTKRTLHLGKCGASKKLKLLYKIALMAELAYAPALEAGFSEFESRLGYWHHVGIGRRTRTPWLT